MIQEEKELLLKDLCCRLPYCVKCNVGDNKPYTLSRIEIDDNNGHLLDFIEMKYGLDMQVYLSEVKPYLFPLSSMNNEQFDEMLDILHTICHSEYAHHFAHNLIDWYNKNHFDYRGLIEKGLAIDATELNIY